MELALSTMVQGERTIVFVEGEVDVHTAATLRRHLDEAILQGRDIVVDLAKVTFLDSTGLGVLVGRLKAVRAQGGTMRIVGARERVLKVFVITGLDRVFEMYPALDDLDSAAS
ncbi:MAG: STAS domain-containing protein [Candidatus Phosphoribacter sp.]|nr:STAS domain-containing protein [Actinomycetales bacterium]